LDNDQLDIEGEVAKKIEVGVISLRRHDPRSGNAVQPAAIQQPDATMVEYLYGQYRHPVDRKEQQQN
jgi:hypothetical protein